ncbi:hypothetical protein LPY66_11295 [Dehalobacter sp. DCM]|uniref:hypothetical protein n=1 Tax=Dehalobacter sp. DCM TaxID=2907827 RepID=UPI00308213F3|nr:hypothetical protein LPY66_11295 [Dehalobacter sp. DCM]
MADESLRTYFKKIEGAANLIERKTGIPSEIISAMMSWETASGTNSTSKYNNELGIKYVGQKYASGKNGMYASYASQADFASDVARILSVNAYGYPGILQAAKTNPSGWRAIVEAWNKSSWAEASYNTDEIIRRAYIAREVQTGTATASGTAAGTSSTSILSTLNVPNPENMSKDDLLKYAGIGAAVVGLIALVK